MLLYRNQVGQTYWINESSLIVGGPTGTEVEDETPTGTIDGINGSFTLAHLPISRIFLHLNGLKLKRFLDFDYSGINITMTTIPFPGDILTADYRY